MPFDHVRHKLSNTDISYCKQLVQFKKMHKLVRPLKNKNTIAWHFSDDRPLTQLLPQDHSQSIQQHKFND